MDRITAARVFISIVEQGSMTSAANKLDMSRAMISRYLEQMEKWANVALLHRSTRKLSLTSQGELVLEDCYKLLEVADKLPINNVANTKPNGTLRINCSQFLANRVLMPFVKGFLQQYPEVTVDLQVDNTQVNLIEQRVDLALRIANKLESNLVARKLSKVESLICASPEYLTKLSRPTSPQDLQQHNCLSYSFFQTTTWSLKKANEEYEIKIKGNLAATNTDILKTAAINGIGIILVPKYLVQKELSENHLIQLLPEYDVPSIDLYAVYHSRKNMTLALRLFIDELASYLQSIEL